MLFNHEIKRHTVTVVLYHFVYHKVHTTYWIELFWKKTFFRFEMDMEKGVLWKKNEKKKKVNYCWETESLHSFKFKIACCQGKHLTSKSGSLQTLLLCELTARNSGLPTAHCLSSPSRCQSPHGMEPGKLSALGGLGTQPWHPLGASLGDVGAPRKPSCVP